LHLRAFTEGWIGFSESDGEAIAEGRKYIAGKAEVSLPTR
jgi:hypothetical protein